MKIIKKIGVILSLIFLAQNLSAQIEKGKVLFSGSSDLSFASSSNSSGGASSGIINIDMGVGYLVTNNIVGGIEVKYFSIKNDETNSSFNGGVFARVYIKNLYPEVRVGIGSSSASGSSFSNTYYGGGLGYAVRLTDFITVDPKLNFTKTVYDGGDATDFGLRIGFSLFF